MTHDLPHEFANTEVYCLFHNCMWQSINSEIEVSFLALFFHWCFRSQIRHVFRFPEHSNRMVGVCWESSTSSNTRSRLARLVARHIVVCIGMIFIFSIWAIFHTTRLSCGPDAHNSQGLRDFDDLFVLVQSVARKLLQQFDEEAILVSRHQCVCHVRGCDIFWYVWREWRVCACLLSFPLQIFTCAWHRHWLRVLRLGREVTPNQLLQHCGPPYHAEWSCGESESRPCNTCCVTPGVVSRSWIVVCVPSICVNRWQMCVPSTHYLRAFWARFVWCRGDVWVLGVFEWHTSEFSATFFEACRVAVSTTSETFFVARFDHAWKLQLERLALEQQFIHQVHFPTRWKGGEFAVLLVLLLLWYSERLQRHISDRHRNSVSVDVWGCFAVFVDTHN